MTFDQLFRYSDPKRVTRSLDVNGPPMDIDAYRDAVYYAFNFKSHVTNTTGLRHRGYIKFFRPRNRQPTPLQHLQCIVDCTCPDYRYRWAWANKQRGSGVVGPRSMNQALNRAPRITNPRSVPGLCKHILATRDYIYGLLSSFQGRGPDTSDKLEKLLKYANKRWADFPGAMAAARARQAALRQRAQLRNVAGPLPQPPVQPPGPVQPPELPEPVELPGEVPGEPEPEELAALPAPPLAVPPEERRKQRAWPGEPKRQEPPGLNKAKGRVAPGGYGSEAERRFNRYGESANVVSSNSRPDMNDLQEAIRLVQELEDETANMPPEPDALLDAPGSVDSAVASPDLPPSEPPISDTALGSDTEGESALDLLRQMRDSLQQLATALAPQPEMGPEGAEGAEGMEGGFGAGPEGEALGADDLDGEFPVPEPGEGEEEEGGEEEGGEEEGEEEDEESNRRPVDAD